MERGRMRVERGQTRVERGQAAWGEASKSGTLQVGVVTLSAEWREGKREWKEGECEWKEGEREWKERRGRTRVG